MAPKIGSQYIIEIEEIHVPSKTNHIQQKLYKVKGSESLLLTEEELAKFTPVEHYNLSLLAAVLGNFTTEDN